MESRVFNYILIVVFAGAIVLIGVKELAQRLNISPSVSTAQLDSFVDKFYGGQAAPLAAPATGGIGPNPKAPGVPWPDQSMRAMQKSQTQSVPTSSQDKLSRDDREQLDQLLNSMVP